MKFMKTKSILTTVPDDKDSAYLVTHPSMRIWRFPVALGLLLCSAFLGAPQAGAQTTYSIWGDSFTPAIPATADPNALVLGVKFQSQVSGYIKGIRFYKGENNAGTHVGKLWTSAGAELASAVFVSETASGWQQQLFASPVPISANTTYVASYYSPSGAFSLDGGYFSGGGHANPPLIALGDGVDGGNGVFASGGPELFPSTTVNAANYWVDVVFAESAGPDTNAPTVVAVSPLAGAVGVSRSPTVAVTFSEAMDPATIANAITLTSSGGGSVASTVAYDAATLTATLTPNSLLALATVYTVAVANGATGVKDLAGNALADAFTASFTTTDQEAFSIWGDAFTPAIPATADPNPLVLGVKFQSEVSGFITGIRFYKGENNTGPHVGKLWTSAGVELVSVTFADETASGWQQQLFASPVPISANTTFVASYYSPSGAFSLDPGYFANGGHTNAPLIALGDGVDGGNGVFASGGPELFPTTSVNAGNYWVDVVMVLGQQADTNPPVIVCPVDLILQCADCNLDPSHTGTATATDDSGSVTVTYSDLASDGCPKVIKRAWLATDGVGNTASCVQTITCLPPSLVTDSSLCIFDRDPATPAQDFRLIFIQDPQNWPCYKLAASNPGQFFYNVFYTGTPGQQVTFNVTLPYPFVTQGANPIHAYDWVTVTSCGDRQCLVPGNAFFVDSQVVKLMNYGKPAAAQKVVPVTLTVPASGVVYLAIHLDYGLKGSSGFTKNYYDDAVDCATGKKILIPNHGTCEFSVAGAQSGSASIQNYNTFKRIPGVAGLVQYKATGNPVMGAEVTLANAKRVPVGASTTDEDGFYMIPYKHTGKVATYYLTLITPAPELYTTTRATKLKANSFVRVDFTVP